MTVHEKAAIGFDRAGDSYERGRPEYPHDAVEFLVRRLEINTSSTVIDLGAGTGKFTKLLIPTGASIIAIEPVAGMRTKFQSLHSSLKVLGGTAEEIPCENQSVDAVVVAQAFHWFNGHLALKEIHRILKPKGKLGLIWNARDESLAWVAELTKIIDPHEGGAPRYKSQNWKKAFAEPNLFSPLQLSQFSYTQEGSVETIVDRIASISFISALPEADRVRVLNQVRKLVETHPETKEQSQIRLPYRTDVYWCEKI